jgi:hypothetical protein
MVTREMRVEWPPFEQGCHDLAIDMVLECGRGPEDCAAMIDKVREKGKTVNPRWNGERNRDQRTIVGEHFGVTSRQGGMSAQPSAMLTS